MKTIGAFVVVSCLLMAGPAWGFSKWVTCGPDSMDVMGRDNLRKHLLLEVFGEEMVCFQACVDPLCVATMEAPSFCLLPHQPYAVPDALDWEDLYLSCVTADGMSDVRVHWEIAR